MKKQQFYELFQEFEDTLLAVSNSSILKQAKTIWNDILKKAIIFFENESLFQEYCEKDITDEKERFVLATLVQKLKIQGYAFKYEWDHLLFASDELHYGLLDALVDGNHLSFEETSFVKHLSSSKLGIFQVKEVLLENAFVILEDLYDHSTYQIYDELLLLDALHNPNQLLFTRLLPVQDVWILSSFSSSLAISDFDKIKKMYPSFTTEAANELWNILDC